MQAPFPIPRQPSILVVRTERHAVLFRLQEGRAQLLDRVPVNEMVGDDLVPRIVQCYASNTKYEMCFLAGPVPAVGNLGLPVVRIPARALVAAFLLLQQSVV